MHSDVKSDLYFVLCVVVNAFLRIRWDSKGYFKPNFDRGSEPFVIPMPPPNVTGSLHMGHAMFVTLEVGEFCVCVCVFFFSCPQCQCDSHISIDIFDIFRICGRPLVQFVSLESSPRDLNTHLLGINKLLCRLQSLLVQFSFYCTRI